MQSMYYIGLDVHKRTISYCVKEVSGRIYAEGSVPATRLDLNRWMKTLPQPWTAAMEATVFSGWIYDHLRSDNKTVFEVLENDSNRSITSAAKTPETAWIVYNYDVDYDHHHVDDPQVIGGGH